jgi:hypothetical protein
MRQRLLTIRCMPAPVSLKVQAAILAVCLFSGELGMAGTVVSFHSPDEYCRTVIFGVLKAEFHRSARRRRMH